MRFFWFLQRHSSESADRGTADQGFSRPRSVLWVTALVLTVFVAWAWFAEIDEVTRASGTVIASSRTQIIQSQDGGRLEALYVAEGDQVEAGQLLARIDRVRAEAAYRETRAKVASLQANVARLQAELFQREPAFPELALEYPEFIENQTDLLRVRRSAIEEEISALEDIRALIQEELALNEPLVASGDVSRTELLRLQRQEAEFTSQISNTRNEYVQTLQTELSQTQEELEVTEQMLVQRQNVLDQTELNAPLRGLVKNLAITTVGGVIRPGDEVMRIVPIDDKLLIEAKISPRDIGFLRPGMSASVKIDAYDSSIYGDLPGELVFISADTIDTNLRQGEQPYYRARVQTSSRQFSGRPNAELDIQPGMTATVEIKTGQRTVMQYLTKPITKTLDESLGER